MSFFQSIAIGTLQGFTEFLPISSSGHLYLAQKYFGLIPNINLELGLHVASLFAIFVFFWEKIRALVIGFFYSITGKSHRNPAGIFSLKLLLATIWTMPLGFLIKDFVQISNQIVGATLLVTAGLILVSEKLASPKKTTLTWKLAIFLGLVQGLAVLPGISRSGLTIAFLILMGIEKKEAAEISFLLAIPTILGAGIFVFLEASQNIRLDLDFMLSVGICFLVSLLTIKFMMEKINRYWIWFAPYCLVLGLGVLFL